eukprot:jgi/Undpi1/9281/HiC_scaffold_26.g11739.m1
MKAGEEEGGEALSKDGDGETEEAGGRQGEGGASGSGGVRGADKGVVSSPSVVPKELTTPRQSKTQEGSQLAIHQDMGRLGSGPGPNRAEYRFWTVLAIGAGAVGSFLAVVVFAVGQYKKLVDARVSVGTSLGDGSDRP